MNLAGINTSLWKYTIYLPNSAYRYIKNIVKLNYGMVHEIDKQHTVHVFQFITNFCFWVKKSTEPILTHQHCLRYDCHGTPHSDSPPVISRHTLLLFTEAL